MGEKTPFRPDFTKKAEKVQKAMKLHVAKAFSVAPAVQASSGWLYKPGEEPKDEFARNVVVFISPCPLCAAGADSAAAYIVGMN